MAKLDSMTGITAFGFYVPSLRLQRKTLLGEFGWINPGLAGYRQGARAVCDFDEDVVTMAVEAILQSRSHTALADISALFMASNNFPFVDRLNTSIVAAACGMPNMLEAVDVANTQRAGLSAFRMAREFSSNNASSQEVICVASDKRRGRPGSTVEMTSGDAAAAFAFGHENVLARILAHRASTVDFVDHYRSAGASYDYGWEERWIRDAGYLKIAPPVLLATLEDAGVSPEDIDHFIFPSTIRGVTAQLAAAAGIAKEAVRDDFQDIMGESGVAHPLLMLADTLNSAGAGEKILLAGFGQGCEAFVLETTPEIATMPRREGVRAKVQSDEQIDLPTIRYLSFNGQLDVDFGARAEADRKTSLSAAYRHAPDLARLVAGKCTVCGTVQFPKAAICVNPNCRHEGEQDDHSLAQEAASIRTITTDWLGFSLNPPNRYGMVEFESGARMIVNFTSTADEPAISSTINMAYRIQEFDPMRNYHRYCWKAKPDHDETGGEEK